MLLIANTSASFYGLCCSSFDLFVVGSAEFEMGAKNEENDALFSLMGGFGRWHALVLIGLGSIVPAVNTLQILVRIMPNDVLLKHFLTNR